jgi:hypothetical protein
MTIGNSCWSSVGQGVGLVDEVVACALQIQSLGAEGAGGSA